VHLPAIDAIQLLLRSRTLIKRKANPQPPPTNSHVIHGNLLSRIAKIIGAPWVGISPDSISTHQIMTSPPPSPRFAKIPMQKFADVTRCRYHSSDRLLPKRRKRCYEQETCVHQPREETHLIETSLATKPHSVFVCLTEITTHDNAKRQESIMLSTSALAAPACSIIITRTH